MTTKIAAAKTKLKRAYDPPPATDWLASAMIVLGILLVASDICPDDDVQLDDDKVPSVPSEPRGSPIWMGC